MTNYVEKDSQTKFNIGNKEETVFNGNQIISIVAKAEAIKEWNSIKMWYNGVEISTTNLKLVFYNTNEDEE